MNLNNITHDDKPEMKKMVLDWPDAEGWWWCDHTESSIVWAYKFRNRGGGEEVGIWCILDEYGYCESNREHFRSACFTRVLEQNPFTHDEEINDERRKH